MKKLFFIIPIIMALAITFTSVSVSASTVSVSKTTSLTKLTSLIKTNKTRITTYTKQRKQYKKTSDEYKTLTTKIDNAKYRLKYYQSRYNKFAKYKTATYVWNYLKDKGYNKYVRAGILGNMMAETGGQTLALKTYYNDGYYYGLINWSIYYTPQVVGLGKKGQMEYLCKSLPKEFKVFGRLSGYTYKGFCNIKNERTAAYAFAKTYERCASYTYSVRQSNATKALRYYTR